MSSSEILKRRAHSFGAVADTYARVRPGYPDVAVDLLLPFSARRVVELGAGTGALTRSLLERGLEVVAVEPDPNMRGVLAKRANGADVRAGSAEQIPVEDGAADAVVGAQMWHWVDLEAATAEVARVLRSGGSFGLIWNFRDESVPWMAELGNLLGEEDMHSGPANVMLPPGVPFEQRENAEFSFSQQLEREDLVGLVASRSQVQVMPDEGRDELLAQVQMLSDTHGDLAGKAIVDVPYVTCCWRAIRT